jgi:hypothetical protein
MCFYIYSSLKFVSVYLYYDFLETSPWKFSTSGTICHLFQYSKNGALAARNGFFLLIQFLLWHSPLVIHQKGSLNQVESAWAILSDDVNGIHRFASVVDHRNCNKEGCSSQTCHTVNSNPLWVVIWLTKEVKIVLVLGGGVGHHLFLV